MPAVDTYSGCTCSLTDRLIAVTDFSVGDCRRPFYKDLELMDRQRPPEKK